MPSAEEMVAEKRLIRRAAVLLCIASQGSCKEKLAVLEASEGINRAYPAQRYGKAVESVEIELTRMTRGY